MEWQDYKAKVKGALEASKLDEAETTLLQALEWVKETGGSHERMCLCLDQLAWIYVNIKDLDRAAACYKESLDIKMSVLGPGNAIVARACKKLATVVYMQKNFDLAEKYSKDALNIFKSTLGMDHEETQQTLTDLISLLRKLGRNIEANILANMGKPKDEPMSVSGAYAAYTTGQSFHRIKVCPGCNLPFDGDYCLRCTEGSMPAHGSRSESDAGKETTEGDK
jgi:tetratricopeptide (TPR) repeat protein